MTNKIYKRKNVFLFDTGETIFTSWKIPYSLYADSVSYADSEATYYADCDDNSVEVDKVGTFATFNDAVSAFGTYMQMIEDSARD